MTGRGGGEQRVPGPRRERRVSVALTLTLAVSLADGLVDVAAHFTTLGIAHWAALGPVVFRRDMGELAHRRADVGPPGAILLIKQLPILETVDARIVRRESAGHCTEQAQHEGRTEG